MYTPWQPVGVTNGVGRGTGDGFLSQFSTANPKAFVLDQEAHSAISSDMNEGPMLTMSCSKDLDVVRIEAGKLKEAPSLFSTYDVLLEVMI